MESASKALMLGFYAIVFAMSLSIMILMYSRISDLYESVSEHVIIKSVLEEDFFER